MQRELPARDAAIEGGEGAPAPDRGERLQPAARFGHERRRFGRQAPSRDLPDDGLRQGRQIDRQDEDAVVGLASARRRPWIAADASTPSSRTRAGPKA